MNIQHLVSSIIVCHGVKVTNCNQLGYNQLNQAVIQEFYQSKAYDVSHCESQDTNWYFFIMITNKKKKKEKIEYSVFRHNTK